MQEVHAVLLTGGSAFGLAAADGVVQWLREHDIGYQTPWAKVPIVPAAVVFDLNVGRPDVWPDSSSGYKACQNASSGSVEEGNAGAGVGATVGKWKGMEFCSKGGVGTASVAEGDLVVGALAVVNAVGDVIGPDGRILAGARGDGGSFLGERGVRMFARGNVLEKSNTTLAVVATNAQLSKLELFKVCERMHDGFARSVCPVHTSYDGDVTFAFSWGSATSDLDLVAELAASVTAEAIRRGVQKAETVGRIPGLAGPAKRL
jgi:L-aminopeptidase/D-esterase-like protein